jgi:hypothetical protein
MPAITIPQAPERPGKSGPPTITGRFQKDASQEESIEPLKLAKQFDSFSATLRLAAASQQTEEFREYISETQKMRAFSGKLDAPAAAEPIVKPAPAPRPAPVFVPIPRTGDATNRMIAAPAGGNPLPMLPLVGLGLLALAALTLLIVLLVR